MPSRSGVTVVHRTPLDFTGARVENLAGAPFESGAYKGEGSVESPIIPARFPFNDLVGSWNAELPQGASVEMQIQVRVNGAWSSWYRLGAWNDKGGQSFGEQKDSWGKMDVDTLKLERSADAFRYRVILAGGPKPPLLKRVAVAYVDSGQPPAAGDFSREGARRELKVPPRTQHAEQEKYRHDICSPTSLAMVLDFWGKRLPTMTVVQAVQDQASQLYGNWPLNVAGAARWGLEGEVARIDFKRLESEVENGRPVVVSISAAPGELSKAPYKKTDGHLIVVSGFTRGGDVVAMDPAGKSKRGVRRVYRRNEIAKVWLQRKLGLAYLLGPAFPMPLAVGVPAADLRADKAVRASSSPDDEERLTQLLYGERVLALSAKDGWVRVRAVEQLHRDKKRWQGYEGWLRADQLRSPADLLGAVGVVRTKRAPLKRVDGGGPDLIVGMGTKLPVESLRGSTAAVRLLDESLAETDASNLNLLMNEAKNESIPKQIISAAEQFIGDRYVWGGRSSVQSDPDWGLDCSGLVSLSYRTVGIDVPRDAHDQFLKAKPIQRSKLEPGDLVFLSRPGKRKDINHVILYAGDETLIESRQSDGACQTLKTSFQERFDRPLAGLDAGKTVHDRTIYFGTFLH